jgi:hypothetical protein
VPGRTSLWILGGAIAPLVYVAAVVLGGVLTPGYSHLAGPIGALTMTGAPEALVLIPLFALYNALLIAFAFTIRDVLRPLGVPAGLLGPTAMAVVALMGALMLFYPMDPLGAPSTEAGRMHVWFAGVAWVATILAVWSLGGAFGRAGWRGLAGWSYAALAAIVVAGIWNVSAGVSPLMGLAERITVGAFLAWVFAVAVALLRPAS